MLSKQKHVIQNLYDRNWKSLIEWVGDFDIADIKPNHIFKLIGEEFENKQTTFEIILCFIFAEYYKAL